MKIPARIKYPFAAAALTAAAVSCTYRPYSAREALFTDIPDNWSEANPAILSFPGDSLPQSLKSDGNALRETSPRLWLRYTLDAPEYVSLIANQETLYGAARMDTLQVRLLDSKGKPTGKGGYAFYEISKEFPDGLYPLPGWVVAIWPQYLTTGIAEIGISFY